MHGQRRGVIITDDKQADEVRSLVLELKGQIHLLGRDWDNVRDPEKKEIAEAAVRTVSELSELVRDLR